MPRTLPTDLLGWLVDIADRTLRIMRDADDTSAEQQRLAETAQTILTIVDPIIAHEFDDPSVVAYDDLSTIVAPCRSDAMAARSKMPHFTPFEIEVLDALWALRSATIRELLESLPDERRPKYTTVQTIVGRLEDKGAVRRTTRVGAALLYEPTVRPRAAYGRFVHDILEVFGGAKAAVAHLLDTGELSLADLKELEALTKKKDN